MPRYKITFDFYDEVDAEDESQALILSTNNIAEWIGSEAVVEEIEDE